MLWSTDSCQNRASLTSITWAHRGLKCRPIEVEYFFEVIRWQITSFKWSQAQVYFFQGFISNMLCLCHYGPALLGFWFQTDLGRENSASFFKSTGGEDFFLPLSRVGHALRPIFTLWLVKIWQVSSCGKFMQHLESCLLWQLRLTEFCVNLCCFELSFPSGCTKWNTAAIKSLLLFLAGLFTGFLVEKCVACENLVIRSRMASFSFFTLLKCKRV